MKCNLDEIPEGSESLLAVQIKDDIGLPIDVLPDDSILFTLHDRQGNIINGRDQEEVFGGPGVFFPEHPIAAMSVVDGVVDVMFAERHSLQDGFLVMLDDIEPGRRDPNGRPFAVTVLSSTMVRLPQADGRDFSSVGLAPLAIVGVFTLPLSEADNAIVGAVDDRGRQKRWALLERFVGGQRIDTPELAYWVIDRQRVS